MVAGAIFVLYFGNGVEAVFKHGGRVVLYRIAFGLPGAALGADDDGPVAAPEAVERCRRSSFEYGERLDIIGVDVPGIGVDRYAIYDVEQVGAAAQEYVGAAQEFGRGSDGKAGDFTYQPVDVVRFACLDELCALDALDGSGDLYLFFSDAQCRDGYFSQAQGGFFQGDVQGCESRCYGDFLGGVAEVGNDQHGFLVGQLDRKLTLEVGHASIIGSFYEDVGADDGLALGGIGYCATQHALRVGVGW